MNADSDKFHNLADIRSQISNAILITLSIVAGPILLGSLLRIQSIGWQPVMILQIFLALAIWAVTLARRHLGFTTRAVFVIGIIFIVGLGGFFNFALNGAGHPAFIVSTVFATVLFGVRTGILVLFLGTISIALFGFAYSTQLIGLHFDSNLYNQEFRSWLTILVGFTLIGGGVIATIVGLNKALFNSITALEKHKADLEDQVAERTRELENQIDEREKVEISLRQSEERYHDVIKLQAELITHFTPDGNFTFVNEAYCRYVGKNEDALLGSSLYDAVPHEELENLKAYVVSFSKDLRHQNIENHVEAADGQLRIFEWSNTAIIDDNGEVLEIQSVGRDITDRKAAAIALQESEKRYRSLVDLSPEAMIVVDNLKIQFSNSAAENLFGSTSPNGLVGKFIFDFIHPDFRDLARNQREKRLERGWVGFDEMEFLKWDGSTFSGEIAGVSISWEGSKSGLIIIRDITERKEVDRLKSEFVSIVSHELRTPLTAIVGALGLISGGTQGEISPAISKLLNIAETNSERLVALVNDILDIEKLQTEGIEFNFTHIDLNDLVGEAVAQIKIYGDECGVEFIINNRENNAFVMADRDRLSQVMSNLLSNAAKFSSEGDQVGVSILKNSENVRVEVSDSGPGIEEEYREKIFDRFSQIDSTDKRAVQGTGLGLSISKAIIDRHGGHIDFDSHLGEGTTFFFDLPLVPPSE